MNIQETLGLGVDESTFVARARAAEAVFVGKLVEVGEPPGSFSGYKAAGQALTYQVERVLQGEIPEGERFRVHQLLVARSPVVDGDQPRLKGYYTRIGVSYAVAVGGTVEGMRVTANENIGPIEATEALLQRLEREFGE